MILFFAKIFKQVSRFLLENYFIQIYSKQISFKNNLLLVSLSPSWKVWLGRERRLEITVL